MKEEELTTPEKMDVTNTETEEVNQVDETNEETSEETVENKDSQKLSTEDDIWNADDIDSLNVDKLFDEPDEDEKPETVESKEEDPLSAPDQETERGLVIKNPVLKFKGRNIPIDSEEELINLAQKGFKLESEMAKIKPQKRMLDIIESGKLTEEELVALSDLKGGKQEAINFFKDRYGIVEQKQDDDDDDYFFGEKKKEVKAKTDYKPEVKQEDPVKEYFTEVSQNDSALAAKVVEIIKDLDATFYREIYSPDIFPGFVEHVKNGMFDKVYPYAIKIRASNPSLPWLAAYNKGVDIVMNNKQPEKKEAPKRVSIPKTSQPVTRVASKDDYDKVWEDDDFYNEIRRKLA
jgi:hypothetical protein